MPLSGPTAAWRERPAPGSPEELVSVAINEVIAAVNNGLRFTANAGNSPTIATNAYDFGFAPSCELPECGIVVELRMSRI